MTVLHVTVGGRIASWAGPPTTTDVLLNPASPPPSKRSYTDIGAFTDILQVTGLTEQLGRNEPGHEPAH
eukprot:165608-Hanusia_phi.AAC.1